MKITKNLEVSAGHRLHRHNGGCFNLHGHNYQLEVTIEFSDSEDKYIGDVGFIVDFKLIKNSIKDLFDHKFLISEEDPLLEKLKPLPGVRVIPYAPTAENIAKEVVESIGAIAKRACDQHNRELYTVGVKLFETSTAFVIHSKQYSENTQG